MIRSKDLTLWTRKPLSCLEGLMDHSDGNDFSSPLSKTLRIGYLDTWRVGTGPCPRDCPFPLSEKSGKPVCTRGTPLEAALHWFPFKENDSHAPKKGYMADETTCPSEGQSWFPRLVPPTGFTLGNVLSLRELRQIAERHLSLSASPGSPAFSLIGYLEVGIAVDCYMFPCIDRWQ